MTLKDLVEEAKKLTREERAELMDELNRIDVADVALTPAQAADLDRRIEEYKSGNVTLIPGDVVMERIRRLNDA
jgi:putative addiction module component (TIGR02574 family)